MIWLLWEYVKQLFESNKQFSVSIQNELQSKSEPTRPESNFQSETEQISANSLIFH